MTASNYWKEIYRSISPSIAARRTSYWRWWWPWEMNQSVGVRHMLEIRRNCTNSWTGGQRLSSDRTIKKNKRVRGTLTGGGVTFLTKIWAKWARAAQSQLAKTSLHTSQTISHFLSCIISVNEFQVFQQNPETTLQNMEGRPKPARSLCKCRGRKRRWSVFYKVFNKRRICAWRKKMNCEIHT